MLGDVAPVVEADPVRNEARSRRAVVDLLGARIDRLPPAAREVLVATACLGNQVPLRLLADAVGRSLAEVVDDLIPALEDGMLVPVDGGRTGEADADGSSLVEVRFRHDRVHQAAYRRLPDGERQALRCGLGRRLADAGLDSAAAGQFLTARLTPADAEERALVVRLYLAAADRERLATNHTAAEQYLAVARRLLREVAEAGAAELKAVETAHHAALVYLGRFDEADELYATISDRCTDPLDLVEAAGAQIAGLVRRTRSVEAVGLGLELLARLGVRFPDDDHAPDEIGRSIAGVAEWAETLSLADDPARPPASDRHALAGAAIVNRMSAPAFFSAPPVSAWLVAERAWAAVRDAQIAHAPEIGRVTISLGVAAVVPADDDASAHLVRRADAALYEAKRSGRDRIVADRIVADRSEDGGSPTEDIRRPASTRF